MNPVISHLLVLFLGGVVGFCVGVLTQKFVQLKEFRDVMTQSLVTMTRSPGEQAGGQFVNKDLQ